MPPPGYTAPCVVRGVITAERLLVDLSADGVEIELILAGISTRGAVMMRPETGERYMAPEASAARDWVADVIAAAGVRQHVFLPRPRHVARWLPSLQPGSRHVGVLYLGRASRSLNAMIATAALETVEVDAQCAYVSQCWNRPHAAA